MNPAVVSLIALVAAIVLSMTSRLNVGLLALGFAWIIGVYLAGLTPEAVIAGFPVSLFVTLAGVTLLFTIADVNGTLERAARRAMRLARGNRRVIPVLLFIIACVLSSAGPGAISSVALLAPVAMVIGRRAGTPPLLTALMVANGANAGNLSPVSAVGVIANTKMAEAGLVGHEGKVWLANFLAHVIAGVIAFALFGRAPLRAQTGTVASDGDRGAPLTLHQRFTMAVTVLWIVGVVGFKLHLGLSAFVAATLLLLARSADEGTAIRQMPWNVLLLVCGVSTLIALLEKTGGMLLFTTLLAQLATPSTVTGVIAFITGAISSYSSTSGVVLPAFLPTIPGLVQQLGGGDPLSIALSINVGSALVDVSPLSTLGALCVAAVTDPGDTRPLFRRLMVWGLAMTVLAAVLCQLFAGAIARA